MRSPAEVAKKFVRNTTAAIPDMQAGIRAVSEAPTVKAARQKTKMLTKLTASVNSGKWEAGLNRVTLADWQTATIDKGGARVGQGVQAAEGKVAAFQTVLQPYIAAGQAALASMPSTTIEDSINRMTTFTRHMSKFKR